ncbi:NAD-dependent epimerase/dehydratase family protein [Sorangium sp. So ce388]|uniref:NAD-dependent epimerase/dehydratase family protein n=1 Tax=Sorangium sp. So ce388 TaxID=3133309 RepID=UPI003F5B3933
MNLNLKDKVVLVTGANGFVGHHVVRRLCEEGMRVRALVRRPESRAELEPVGAEVVLGELADRLALEKAVRGAHFVVHCAATNTPDLAEARRVNAEATATLAEAALAAGCERFVHISTVAAYPLMNAGGVVTEAAPLTTEGDAYAVTKADAERELSAVAARGLRTVVLRPAVVLGVHPTSFWGTRFPQAIAAGQFPLVDGGERTMGYLHISSLVEAVVRSLGVDEAIGQAFNILDGHFRWREYTAFFSAGPLPAAAAEQVPGFLSFHGTFSTEKAQRVLGLAPKDTFASSMAEITGAPWQA